jgi:hypothetical protein
LFRMALLCGPGLVTWLDLLRGIGSCRSRAPICSKACLYKCHNAHLEVSVASSGL